MFLLSGGFFQRDGACSAADCLTSWGRTNIGDRNRTVDLLVDDLRINSPSLNATQVNQKGQEITEKVSYS